MSAVTNSPQEFNDCFNEETATPLMIAGSPPRHFEPDRLADVQRIGNELVAFTDPATQVFRPLFVRVVRWGGFTYLLMNVAYVCLMLKLQRGERDTHVIVLSHGQRAYEQLREILGLKCVWIGKTTFPVGRVTFDTGRNLGFKEVNDHIHYYDALREIEDAGAKICEVIAQGGVPMVFADDLVYGQYVNGRFERQAPSEERLYQAGIVPTDGSFPFVSFSNFKVAETWEHYNECLHAECLGLYQPPLGYDPQ